MIPEFSVSNFNKSLGFYVNILGFKIEYKRKNFAFLSFNGTQIMIEQQIAKDSSWQTGKLEYPFGRGVNFQIEVKDIYSIIKSLKKNKYSIKMLPKDNWYRKDGFLLGNKEFLVMDPDGYLLRFFQDIGKKPI
jgi:catechol 2,3-dioxygenase-like lactoylglutathione lyase family enzyme